MLEWKQQVETELYWSGMKVDDIFSYVPENKLSSSALE